MESEENLKARLAKFSRATGFVAMGVCRPDSIPQAGPALQRFLRENWHGQMDWLEKRSSWRGSPASLWPQARSVIMLADSYTPDFDPLTLLEARQTAAISAYAGNRDYHDIVKKRLKKIGRWLIEQRGSTEIKVFVDTAPVMEKPLAAAAGLGWQGKHTNLLGRDFGNWAFLGAIFTTLELPADSPGEDRCGSCTACLDICPTKAFPAPHQLDARRCISYLTIEHAGPVDEPLRRHLGNRIYGCDDCLAICPWNKFAKRAQEQRYQMGPDLKSPPLEELASLEDAQFREKFSGSAIKRIGRDRFVRNVLYAIGNSGAGRLADAARALVDDPDPGVADAALWALAELARAQDREQTGRAHEAAR